MNAALCPSATRAVDMYHASGVFTSIPEHGENQRAHLCPCKRNTAASVRRDQLMTSHPKARQRGARAEMWRTTLRTRRPAETGYLPVAPSGVHIAAAPARSLMPLENLAADEEGCIQSEFSSMRGAHILPSWNRNSSSLCQAGCTVSMQGGSSRKTLQAAHRYNHS